MYTPEFPRKPAVPYRFDTFPTYGRDCSPASPVWTVNYPDQTSLPTRYIQTSNDSFNEFPALN